MGGWGSRGEDEPPVEGAGGSPQEASDRNVCVPAHERGREICGPPPFPGPRDRSRLGPLSGDADPGGTSRGIPFVVNRPLTLVGSLATMAFDSDGQLPAEFGNCPELGPSARVLIVRSRDRQAGSACLEAVPTTLPPCWEAGQSLGGRGIGAGAPAGPVAQVDPRLAPRCPAASLGVLPFPLVSGILGLVSKATRGSDRLQEGRRARRRRGS
jgi:hypothetical protein